MIRWQDESAWTSKTLTLKKYVEQKKKRINESIHCMIAGRKEFKKLIEIKSLILQRMQ